MDAADLSLADAVLKSGALDRGSEGTISWALTRRMSGVFIRLGFPPDDPREEWRSAVSRLMDRHHVMNSGQSVTSKQIIPTKPACLTCSVINIPLPTITCGRRHSQHQINAFAPSCLTVPDDGDGDGDEAEDGMRGFECVQGWICECWCGERDGSEREGRGRFFGRSLIGLN
jgi:hypothetical protein